MDFIRYSDIGRNEWNFYLDQINGITFNYTAQWISFAYEYSKTIISNESFLVLENRKPIAAAVIFIENSSNKNQISWNDGYCFAPFIDHSLEYRLMEKYAKKILLHIDEIAKNYSCTSIRLRADSLGNPDEKNIFYNYNFLLKHGYMDYSGMSQIIDLRKNKKQLYADIYKGHKQTIKKGSIYDIKIYDATTMTDKLIEKYKEIYEKDAGKVTRNSELYRYYLEFIKSGMGLAAYGRIDNQEVSVALVTMYKKTAYYSSYAELQDLLNCVPVGHAMQWQIINYLKDHGIEFYDMGEQFFGKTHFNIPDQKNINISYFKRAFGGYTVPIWRGIKLCEDQPELM